MKICSSCSIVQDASQFRKGSGWCRQCRNAYNQKWKADHADELNARKRASYAANPDVHHAYSAKYRAAHKDQRAKSWAKWYDGNRESRAEYQRQYRNEHRSEFQESDRGRYQRDSRVSARRLVQRMVATGRLPKASERRCVDCVAWAEEYDHHMGYEGEARKLVEPVCKLCHGKRTLDRAHEKQVI